MARDFQGDYLPPQDIDAEQSVLGAIILNPETFVSALEYIDDTDFYRRAHQLIFKSMMDLNDKNEPIDAMTIKSVLESEGNIEDAGGFSYLGELSQVTPSSTNVSYYAQIVEKKSLLRRLIETSNEISRSAYENDGDVLSVLNDAEQKILKVSEKRNRSGFASISEVLNQAVDHIDELYQRDEQITGISTGYKQLDQMTSGLHEDELIILAARPGVGKTAFALNVAQNIGTDTDETIAIFSLEMGAQQLVNRMLCAEGNIDAGNLRNGTLTPEEYQHLFVAMGSLSNANIYIDDTPGIRTNEIRAKCRRLKQERGSIGLIVIDYLQLIEGSSNRESRQQQVSDISRQLKKLAKELSVPVIALSQLSRSVEQRQDKRPILSDLRESGSIEQDADIVAFLYREDYYRAEDGEEDDRILDDTVEVIIEKNRSGARGTVKLNFKKEYNKFTSIVYRSEDDMPPGY